MDREAVQSASIWITDLNGNLKADYGVEDLRGEVTVSSAALQPGIYLYSLIINGEVADTKKMVIK
jgi:hypothetical protein